MHRYSRCQVCVQLSNCFKLFALMAVAQIGSKQTCLQRNNYVYSWKKGGKLKENALHAARREALFFETEIMRLLNESKKNLAQLGLEKSGI